MSQDGVEEEEAMEMDQEEDSDGEAGVMENAESDTLEAKTQENPRPHPTRLPRKRLEVRETSLQCGIE